MAKPGIRAWFVWLFLFIFLLPLSGSATADAGVEGLRLEEEVDSYRVELVFASEQLKPGETPLAVRFWDQQGEPVEGLQVSLVAHPEAEEDDHAEEEESEESGMDMHGEESQAEEETEAVEESDLISVSLEPGHKGEYEGALEFTSQGHWQVVVHVVGKDLNEEIPFAVKVHGNGSKWIFLGSILAINVSVLAAAAVLKPKPVVKLLVNPSESEGRI